ncbi:MAG TPA: hypothetical protein VN634_12165 [Candidatus Limnocylindrales bacterium]|nr:hypothetical protein [Candidatus Limnocylindrales bacterium]
MSYYAEKYFFEDETTIEANQRLAEGKLVLDWFDVDAEKVRVVPSDFNRGLTYDDCNVGGYGWDAIPENIRRNYSMAARGSVLVPGLPDLGYTLNRKSEVWSNNCAELYEESKSRRWAPAVDIDWEAVRANPLSPPCTHAMRQLCTALLEIALGILEFPGRWVFWINQEFLELKSLHCAQMIDQARHVEVFRKRAMTIGGLGRASVAIEQAVKELISADTYTSGSLSVFLMLNSIVLGLFRTASSASSVDAKMFRLCMQDTARQIAYATGQLRFFLGEHPAKSLVLHEHLDQTEHVMVGILAAPELLEPLIVLAGGGTSAAQVSAGRDKVLAMHRGVIGEYLERLASVGLERRGRTRLEKVFS